MTTAEPVTSRTVSIPAQQAADRTERRSAAAARDPFFDNAKFLLIVLVVIGHNWYPLIGHSRAVKAAYMVVYAFHMPAFILLSGYFSRSFEARPDQVRRLIRSVLLPFLIFEPIYLVVVALADGHPIHFDGLTYPSFLCWFLVALFAWRLTAPVWRAVPRPVVISVLVSLAAGLMNVSLDLALSRILQFLPWFVAGLFLKGEHFQWLHRRAVRCWAAVVLIGAVPVAYAIAPQANVDWLNMETDASSLGVGTLAYLGIRLLLLAASTLLVASVLALVPKRQMWLTALGTFTMYPFLLHGLIVKGAQANGLYDAVVNGGPPAVAALTLGAITLAVVLATPPVRKVARWAVDPLGR